MCDEWELSKENVQPLKSGRKFDDLTAALQPQQTSAVMEEKRQFETELRTYCGSDPLDVWDRYIAWTEQHHPSGGKDSHLLELLERCVAEFKDDEKYKNDTRYVDVWLKFVNRCKDCMEIYTFLSAQGIGSQVAALYEAWAWDLERIGNCKKADKVYQQGITAGAQPLEHLRKSHSEFQARVARKMMSKEPMDTGGAGAGSGSQRAALGDLRGQGKHHSVSTSRTGSARQTSKGGIPVAKGPLENNNAGGGFAIFSDEAAGPVAGAAGKQSLVTQGRNKENQKTPGVWTDARVKQKSVGTVPLNAVSQEPEFKVHEDAEEEQPMVTPRKAMPQMSTALSVKKEKADPFQRVQQQSAAAALEFLPMYNKNQVYKGTSEMSFEELRAASWKARQKDLQEKRQMEDKLHAMQSELQQVKEMCANLMTQKQQPAAAPVMLAPQHPMQPGPNPAAVPYSGMPQPLPQIRVHNPHPEASQPIQPVAQQLLLPAPPHQPSQPAFAIHSDQSLNSTRTPSMNASSFSGPMLSSGGSLGSRPLSGDPTPDSSTCSFRNMSRGRLCAPSPTVNTREAMANMQGLFNETLNIQDHFGLPAATIHDDQEDEFAATIDAKRQSVAAPFAIFSDQEEQAKPAASGGAGFQIFCDPNQENIKPELKYHVPDAEDHQEQLHSEELHEEPKRKCLSSILRRSTVGRKSEAFGDDEIVGSQKDEPMDQLEFMADDMTFMPGVSSTKNFTEMRRYASTPFNPMDAPSLAAPPVSSIKPVGDQGRIQDGTFACPMGVPPHAQAKGRLNSTGSSFLSKNSQEHSQVSVSQPQSFSATNMTDAQQSAATHDLSPILEASDEDAKSTSHSTQSSQASTASGPGSVYRSYTTGSSSSQPRTPEAPVLSHTSIKAPPPQPMLTSTVPQTLSPPEEEIQAITADQTFHEIDTSNYCPPETDERTQRLLYMSVCIDPSDPFSKETISLFLSGLCRPISSYPGYYRCQGDIQKFEIGSIFQFDDDDTMYSDAELIGKGAYGSVYKVSEIGSETTESVLKVQKPSHEWEFYIVSELHQRLSQLQSEVDVDPSVMRIHKAHFFDDGCCFLSDFRENGTLLDLVNRFRKTGKGALPESLAMFVTIELLHVMEQIHQCNIIHGDLKPDNFLVRKFPRVSSPEELYTIMTQTHSVELIDFGRSIDMNMYPEGTTFVAKVATKDFQCIEMRTNQPWTYQTDLFGLAGTVHVLLLGSYMNVYQIEGKWKTTSSFRRTFKHSDMWLQFFQLMLNIPSCEELPDLRAVRQQLQQRFFSDMAADYVANYQKWEDKFGSR